MPGKRQAGCRFFLVTSLLDAQKRKLFALKPQQRDSSIARKRVPTRASRHPRAAPITPS
jgi:hypothetical protein